MSLDDMLRQMRAQLRSQLPPRAFLKRDRGDSLFVSNAPAIDPSFSGAVGFTCTHRGQLAFFLPDESRLARLEACHRQPPDTLSASLARFRGADVAHETLVLFAQGVKLLDQKNAPEADIAAFDRALRQTAAVALRGGISGGGLYALSLIDHTFYAKGDLL